MQMVSIKCNELADSYPFGMREFIESMDDVVQLAIVTELIGNQSPLYPSELSSRLNLAHIEDALKKLSNNGIIHTTEHELDDDGRISRFKYDVYPIWVKLLDVMRDTLSNENARGI